MKNSFIFYIITGLAVQIVGGKLNETYDIIDSYEEIEPRKIAKKGDDLNVPYQISLQSKAHNGHYCSGAIISRRHALTAGHCLDKEDWKKVRVISGTVQHNIGGDRHKIVAIWRHPEYSPNHYDLAIIKVRPKFDFTKATTKPIVIDPNPIGINEVVYVSGWGTIVSKNLSNPDQLRVLSQLTMDKEWCQPFMKIPINDDILCTFTPKTHGTCEGDEGNPLVSKENPEKPMLVGIAAKRGDLPCAIGAPDLYTRLSVLADFINNVISNKVS